MLTLTYIKKKQNKTKGNKLLVICVIHMLFHHAHDHSQNTTLPVKLLSRLFVPTTWVAGRGA